MICAGPAANAGMLARTLTDFRIIWATLPVIGAVLVAAAIIAFVQRWRKRPGPEPISPSDQLSQFRSLYEAGELSAEEYARIRAKLGAKIKQVIQQPGPGDSGPTPPPPANPDTNIRPGPNGAT
jgi:putative oligomerization/nucleic acid binding protein